MTQLSQCFGFDLPYTLAGHIKLLSNFLKCMIGIHLNTKPHTQDFCFSRRQRIEYILCYSSKTGINRSIGRRHCSRIFYKVTKM